MKVFGQEQLVGAAPVEKLLAYVLSLPISLASLGMPRLEHIERNAELARTNPQMSLQERKQLSESIAAAKRTALINFLKDHQGRLNPHSPACSRWRIVHSMISWHVLPGNE